MPTILHRADIAASFFLVLLLGAAANAGAQESEDDLADFGLRSAGGRHKVHLYATNTCSQPHTVTFSIAEGDWLRLSEDRKVVVQPGDQGAIDVILDLRELGPGKHEASVELTCDTCQDDGCEVEDLTQRAVVEIPFPSTFGASSADASFGGLVGGKPVDVVPWLKNLVKTIKASTFGSTSRGKKILRVLENSYLDGALSDITIVPSVDKPGRKGRLRRRTPPVNGEKPRPGDAAYVREQTIAYQWMEEIYVGIDQSQLGIAEARRSPQEYEVLIYQGKMSVLKKADIVHNIIHEGLHAVHEGKYNLGGGACLEEERDAFKAGNDAAKALNLPIAPTLPVGKAYNNAQKNPNYVPLALRLEDLPPLPVARGPEPPSDCPEAGEDCEPRWEWTLRGGQKLEFANGSFEEGVEAGSFTTLGAGSEAIRSWRVTQSSIDYVGSYFPSAHGSRHIDLDGSPGVGGIAQTFSTVPGKRYRVTFQLAGNPDCEPLVKQLAVDAAGQARAFSHSADLSWTPETWQFEANEPQTTLRFRSLTLVGRYCGALLDDVRVEEVRISP